MNSVDEETSRFLKERKSSAKDLKLQKDGFWRITSMKLCQTLFYIIIAACISISSQPFRRLLGF
jgi:hypothetical protein